MRVVWVGKPEVLQCTCVCLPAVINFTENASNYSPRPPPSCVPNLPRMLLISLTGLRLPHLFDKSYHRSLLPPHRRGYQFQKPNHQKKAPLHKKAEKSRRKCVCVCEHGSGRMHGSRILLTPAVFSLVYVCDRVDRLIGWQIKCNRFTLFFFFSLPLATCGTVRPPPATHTYTHTRPPI